MEDNKTTMIPYIVYESMLDKEDRQQRRMVIIIVLLVILLFGSNAFWLYEWSQYEYVSDEETVDVVTSGEGDANYIGEDGAIINAESNSKEKDN